MKFRMSIYKKLGLGFAITFVLVLGLIFVTFHFLNIHSEVCRVTDSDFAIFNTALDLFKLECGVLPTNKQGLEVLLNNPGIKNWNGPYIRGVPLDPWGTPYQYKRSTFGYKIRSAGVDLKFDTSDDLIFYKKIKL